MFGRGLAEAVTDPELTAEPLARPGDVIKRLRGTEEEHLAALDEGTETARPSPKKAPPTRKKKVQPRPDRKALDQAEEALDAAEREAAKVSERFRERERQLAREREAAQRTATDAAKRARRARDTERERYSRALERWRNR